MIFDCPICECQYSNSNKLKGIPCGHTICERCLNKIIKNKNLECPICRKSYQNINISNFPVIYQLINEQNGKKSVEILDKAFEVCDQINYLNYAGIQLSIKYQEFQKNISEVKEEIIAYLKIIIALMITFSYFI